MYLRNLKKSNFVFRIVCSINTDLQILSHFSNQVAKSINCDSSIVIATHPHSRKIFEQLGMDTIKYVDYKYVVVEGKRPYFNANYNNSKGISSHYMKLK